MSATPIVYGARLKVKDGQKVEQGQKLVEWEPYAFPILSEVAGRSSSKNGRRRHGHEEVDEDTGLPQHVIIESPDERSQPAHRDPRHQEVVKIREVPTCRSRPPAGRDGEDVAPATSSPRSRARHQDQGHHRRSAARCRALRSSQAEETPSWRRSTAS